MEYGRSFRDSNLKPIKPFKEQTWNLLWWNYDDELEFLGDILYWSLRTIYGGRTYYHETTWMLVNYYNAAIDLPFITSVISVAFLQTLHRCCLCNLYIWQCNKIVFLSCFTFSEKAVENHVKILICVHSHNVVKGWNLHTSVFIIFIEKRENILISLYPVTNGIMVAGTKYL